MLAGTAIRLKTIGLDKTVLEDTDKDTLKGGDERDWYFADFGVDDLKDRKSNEFLN